MRQKSSDFLSDRSWTFGMNDETNQLFFQEVRFPFILAVEVRSDKLKRPLSEPLRFASASATNSLKIFEKMKMTSLIFPTVLFGYGR